MSEKNPLTQANSASNKSEFLSYEEDIDGFDDIQLNDWFYERLESIPAELAEKWERKLELPNVNFKQLCSDFSTFIAKRKMAQAELKADIRLDATPEERRQLRRYLEMLTSSMREDNFLGNGACAEVFITDEHPDICVKYIYNNERYVEGNNIREESNFLEELSEYAVDGVRTPNVLHTFSGGGFVAIVMERVHGANLQRVVEGLDELPDSFDYDNFFKSLWKYMDTLHNEKKIYHRDLHLRNIMVDASTGLPVLIDFGKSIQYPLHDPREALDCDLDKAQFQSAKAKMRTYLQEHNKHGIDTKD